MTRESPQIPHDQLPHNCPKCRAPFTEDERWPNILLRNGLAAIIGAGASVVWSAILVTSSGSLIVPRSLGGIGLFVIVYCWPWIVSWKLAMKYLWPWVELKCRRCPWTQKFKIDPDTLPDLYQ